MSGDREPIGRKNNSKKSTRKRAIRRWRDGDDDDNDNKKAPFNGDSYDNEDYLMSPKIGHHPKGKKYRWASLFIKLLLITLLLLSAYGIYLDAQIRSRIDGKVWQLPAAVYGRMLNLEPGMICSKNEIITLLEGMQYRQVSRITRAGEFTVHNASIEVLRRSFDFPDGLEGEIHAHLLFNDNSLTRIENLDNQRSFGFFRLDPKLITMLQSPNGEQRLFVPRAGFPELLVNTLLVTEDRQFYQHEGISFNSIARAALANLTAGRTVQGGSTLTQQLVKNLFLTNKRSLWRKANEAYMALLVDFRYSKDRILELYLNEVYLGQSGDDQIHGFPLASLYYFGRPVNELSLDQQALLVGMVKGASLYNPWRNPTLALKRRNLILTLLQNHGVIDAELYRMLSTRSLGVQPKSGAISPQPAFMQMVRHELQQKLGDRVNDLSGVKIFTTLDPVSQNAAERAVEVGIPVLKAARHLNDLEAAIVVVDRFTGEIRSIVGGAQPQFAGFNRARDARRPIGSLAKPAIYLSALSQPDKYRLNSWLDDQPLSLKQAGAPLWQPKNYDRQFRGRVMLVDALANSLNIPTVNLGLAIGLDQISTTLQHLGIAASLINPVPAMLLGSTSLTPVEVAQEYQTIASGGNRASLSALRSVIAEDGTVLYQSFPQAERTVPAQAAMLTLYSMQQAVSHGTSRSLAAKYSAYHLAAKTGTTNDLRDSWFAGIDGKEVAIIWVGRDNYGPAELTGASGALTLYRRYLENQSPLPLVLSLPEGINMMNIDSAGNFICNQSGSWRVIPVWTEHPQRLCQASQGVVRTEIELPQQQTGHPENREEKNREEKQREENRDVAAWIKEMFGL